ncbi:uncharacterized protein SPSK_10712 [Sporothrix schenckii 1099-18]|uniref:Uncharacterized protein n=1 Tax=Sporothrix schenckii 1099-18 TaxID=1397361 RepID=A0A0F2MLV6_SPOSC|nr:uncharacterized protein SPSK_10712 [Sporothrix schenckii 1099-18]KJR89166.1 hypothetical protein SPSK_10712 [Sporothrix schenckii 1099-18]
MEVLVMAGEALVGDVSGIVHRVLVAVASGRPKTMIKTRGPEALTFWLGFEITQKKNGRDGEEPRRKQRQKRTTALEERKGLVCHGKRKERHEHAHQDGRRYDEDYEYKERPTDGRREHAFVRVNEREVNQNGRRDRRLPTGRPSSPDDSAQNRRQYSSVDVFTSFCGQRKSIKGLKILLTTAGRLDRLGRIRTPQLAQSCAWPAAPAKLRRCAFPFSSAKTHITVNGRACNWLGEALGGFWVGRGSRASLSGTCSHGGAARATMQPMCRQSGAPTCTS